MFYNWVPVTKLNSYNCGRSLQGGSHTKRAGAGCPKTIQHLRATGLVAHSTRHQRRHQQPAGASNRWTVDTSKKCNYFEQLVRSDKMCLISCRSWTWSWIWRAWRRSETSTSANCVILRLCESCVTYPDCEVSAWFICFNCMFQVSRCRRGRKSATSPEDPWCPVSNRSNFN